MGWLPDWATAEAGQKRRQWLDAQDAKLKDTLQYYLGPGIDVGNTMAIADAFNPVSDIGRAGTAMRGVVRPGASVSERVGALGNVATDMASVLAPVAGAAYADDAARGLTEGLANLTMPADDAVTRLIADESGAIRAWHGSPHDFDRFSMDRIGTGEGAQAYGHGLYFAESPGVARSYQEALSGRIDPSAQGYLFKAGGDKDAAVEAMIADLSGRAPQKHIENLRQEILSADMPRGRLYEVNIDANPEDFLDWDAPLSAQPETLRSLVQSADLSHLPEGSRLRRTIEAHRKNPGDWTPDPGAFIPEPTGNEIHSALTDFGTDAARNAEMTRNLAGQGIPGIRYLDAGSRSAGDGSRNYVLFDDNLVSILNKYGLAGLMAGGAGYGMAQEEQY